MFAPLYQAMINFIATNVNWPNSKYLDRIYDYLFIDHNILTGIMIVSFVSSVLVFGISVVIMTMYKKPYPLDRATYFREIALFLVLVRVVNGYFFDWRWPIFTATVYTLLFVGVVWYVVEIVRERGINLSWKQRQKTKGIK